MISGIFHSHFSSRLINNLQEFKHDTNSNEIDITLQLLKTTITATLMYVVNVVCIKESINQNKENTIHDNRALDYLQINSICNPKFFLDDEEFDAFKLINAFYGIIKADFNRTWNEKEWFIDFV